MENDALKDLMQAISDEGDTGEVANNGDEPTQEIKEEPTQVVENEPDYKAMFEAYKSENDSKLNALMSELEALKNPKKRAKRTRITKRAVFKRIRT